MNEKSIIPPPPPQYVRAEIIITRREVSYEYRKTNFPA